MPFSFAAQSPKFSATQNTGWFVLPVIAVIALFIIKYQVSDLKRQVTQMETEMNDLNERGKVLQTEWTYLRRPDYIQRLNDKFLTLQPPTADQIVDWGEVNNRLEQAPLVVDGATLANKADTNPTTAKPANDNAPVHAVPANNNGAYVSDDQKSKNTQETPANGLGSGVNKKQ